MIKIFISPNYLGAPAKADNAGIRRVCEAMIKHLPTFGIEGVSDPKQAHIIANHGGMQTHIAGIPIVHISHGLYWSRQPWSDGFMDVNKTVVDAMKMAVAHTVPSNWVAKA